MMEHTNISPELATVLETIVAALEISAGANLSVNVTRSALAARAALTKALQVIPDDVGGAV